MNILVIGSGAREHTLVWKLAQSEQVKKIYAAPGNGGIAESAECVPIAADAIEELAGFAQAKAIDLTVVGPEQPLTGGIVDYFQSKGLKIFGPTQKAAMIEGSKAFAKEFMSKYHIPTAPYKIFDKIEDATKFIKEIKLPVVIKADGLAAGKGAVIVSNLEHAEQTLKEIMVLKGGMGAFSPVPFVSNRLMDNIIDLVLEPAIRGMTREGRPYKGVLYAGLMITDFGPRVIEFNCRFGDPETQVVLPLLDVDLAEIMMTIAEQNLRIDELDFKDQYSVGVVLASGGYPKHYEKGYPIKGIELAQAGNRQVFHAGTQIKDGQLVTSGGRVVTVCGQEENLQDAIAHVYEGVEKIIFEDAHYRKDIAARASRRKFKLTRQV
jgi:phosphoribosylamine--glycine ligase